MGRQITVFMDERLRVEEEKDYLSRADKVDTTALETFFSVQHRMGTISVITDLDENGERIYNLLKSRAEIETMFDAFKNVLHADRAYMRDNYQLEGRMFINFVALVFYYRLYRHLADNALLKKYSPGDVLLHLARLYRLKIQDRWLTAEIQKQTRDLLGKLCIPIT